MQRYKTFLLMPLVAVGSLLCGNACSKTDQMLGSFVSLKEGLGGLSEEDVMNIAYRNNHGHLYDVNFQEVDASSYPIKAVGVLSESLTKTILNDFYLFRKDDPYFLKNELRKEDVSINVYCGNYNGYEAIQFNRPRNPCLAQKWYQNFNGWLLEYPCQGELWLWRPSGANVN